MSTHRATTDSATGPGPLGAVPDLVICEQVAHTYGTGVTAVVAVVAVHDVTCRVLPGSRVAITGPSGSGKSTLLHLLAGLESVTAGTMCWPGLGGHPLAHPGRIGIIFQGPSLLPALDALENVTFPLLLANTGEGEARELAWGAMRRLRITDLAGKLPQELSGGQAQRVAVARVLAADPALILADEPTGQLDHHAAALVMDVLAAGGRRARRGPAGRHPRPADRRPAARKVDHGRRSAPHSSSQPHRDGHRGGSRVPGRVMITLWLRGLLRRRPGRLLAAAAGIAVAVALLASLGAFLAHSQATMTDRAVRGVGRRRSRSSARRPSSPPRAARSGWSAWSPRRLKVTISASPMIRSTSPPHSRTIGGSPARSRR